MGFFDNVKQASSSFGQNAGATVKVEIGAIPASLSDFQARVNFKDSNSVVAFTILALCVYPHQKDFSIEMLNYLKGPGELSAYDKQFLRDRFAGKDYLAISYLDGATPDNNYTPQEPFVVTVKKTAHSEDALAEGYLQLFVTSGGADSERGIRLRKKPSTGEWFLWEYFVLSGIREPKGNDPWA